MISYSTYNESIGRTITVKTVTSAEDPPRHDFNIDHRLRYFLPNIDCRACALLFARRAMDDQEGILSSTELS